MPTREPSMTNVAEFEETVGAAKGGHPKGLYVLFGAEMWERFSYYGMRALLVLYLTKHLKMDRPGALDIYATYTGLVYLTPLLGGYLADTFLGQRKAILIGGSLMALGHFAMAFEPLLYMALGLLILGNGFFKPNISTMVGQLYPQGDARRDSAYTIFYMGINLGAFFSPLVCGTLGERLGWHYGFGAAGVGMVFGLLTFSAMQQALGTQGYPPDRAPTDRPRLVMADWVHVTLLTLAGVGIVYAALTPSGRIAGMIPQWGWILVLGYWTVLAFALIAITALVTGGSRRKPAVPSPSPEPGVTPEVAGTEDIGAEEKEDPHAPFTAAQWQRIAVILIVAIFSIVFWMGFEQAGGTLTLFADQKTRRVLFGEEFPASWYQSVNPLLIFILAPLFSLIWTTLDRTRFALTSTAKMGIGLILLGLGFVVMAGAEGESARSGGALVGPQWLTFVYLLFTLGELCLSPIGLSLVNKLAPARVASLMMALWFTSTAIANYLAGKLEAILESSEVDLWTFLIFTSIVPGVLLLVLTPVLKKMGHGRI
jgi:POT family proton-dependent oligopeptide transporter